MAKRKVTDAEATELIRAVGIRKAARSMGMNRRGLQRRRARVEEAHQTRINSPLGAMTTRPNQEHPQRILLTVDSGQVLIGSDGHYWPGLPTTAHKAFLLFAKELRPSAIIVNGDVFDGSRISRYPPIGWERTPTVIDELQSCQERLAEIEQVAPDKCALAWNLGNHDSRFETRLAGLAPEFARVHGFHLKDHFSPRWQPAWSTWINDDKNGVIVKHRHKGGQHAPHNNTLWGGRTVVTGHLHSQKVSPITDYNGTRWGVDTGCLADADGQQFVDYTEDNCKDWRSGFALLTFHKGRLLPPELITVWSKASVTFRGQIIAV